LQGSVYVSFALDVSHNFKLTSGDNLGPSANLTDTHAMWTLDTSKYDRVLFNLEPTTIKFMKQHLLHIKLHSLKMPILFSQSFLLVNVSV
jgi:hypothetical protein